MYLNNLTYRNHHHAKEETKNSNNRREDLAIKRDKIKLLHEQREFQCNNEFSFKEEHEKFNQYNHSIILINTI